MAGDGAAGGGTGAEKSVPELIDFWEGKSGGAAAPPPPPPKKKKPPAKKKKEEEGPDHLLIRAGGTTATFLVAVEGQEVGRFSEVSGLQVEVEMETFKEGGENGFVHQLPGRMTWPNIVLKRGVTHEDNLFAWFNSATGKDFATTGKAARTTMAVTLINNKGVFLRSWNVEGAVPVRWTGPTFASATEEMPVEELEVAHHGFTTSSHT